MQRLIAFVESKIATLKVATLGKKWSAHLLKSSFESLLE